MKKWIMLILDSMIGGLIINILLFKVFKGTNIYTSSAVFIIVYLRNAIKYIL